MSTESLESFIQIAKDQQASDLHLEPSLPICLRVRGNLRLLPERVTHGTIYGIARQLLVGERWQEFQERQSYDMSRTVCGVRCRINIMRTARGVGMAIRLLSNFQASLKRLNLHPDLAKLVGRTNGLIVVSGPTGAGKSSTLAALLHEINNNEARHIITIESPIEYALVSRKSFVRQREVGRDSPSFSQALLDALREDPDVLMVGEMRDPETMRLTLNASETGHLVLTTLHSSTCTEALQRLVSAFPPESQASVCAQLADCLVGVVCQRLGFRQQQGVQVPELEILVATTPARAVIRSGALSKLQTAIETGGQDGSFSFARYRDWLDRRTDYYVPRPDDHEPPPDDLDPESFSTPPPAAAGPTRHAAAPARPAPPVSTDSTADNVLEIDADADDPAAIVAELERRR